MSLRLIRVVDGETHSQEIHQKPRRYRDEGLVLVGDNILWVPFVSECLVSRVLTIFGSDYLFKDICICLYSRQPWKTEIGSPSRKRAGSLTAYCKRFKLPRLQVPPLSHQPTVRAEVSWSSLWSSTCGNWG